MVNVSSPMEIDEPDPVATWREDHLDEQVLAGDVTSTRKEQRQLAWERCEYQLEKGLDTFLKINLVSGAVYKVPIAIATFTAKRLRHVIGDQEKNAVVTIDFNGLPYIMDVIYAFWMSFRLDVRWDKSLQHALMLPSDSELLNVTNRKTNIDALMDIMIAGYELEDQPLINAALASMLSRFVYGRYEPMEWIAAIKRAYTIKYISPEHADVQRRVLLTSRSIVRPIKSHSQKIEQAFEKALESSVVLQRGWAYTLKWYEMHGSPAGLNLG